MRSLFQNGLSAYTGGQSDTRAAWAFGLLASLLPFARLQDRASTLGTMDIINRLVAAAPKDLPPALRRDQAGIFEPLSYIVPNAAEDVRASILAIRAFALAGRWGDRLTLYDCGARSGQFKRWARALRIEGAISFAESQSPEAQRSGEYDVAIIGCRAGHLERLLTSAFEADLRIIALDRSVGMAMPFDRDRGMVVPGDDLQRLIQVMLKIRSA